MPTDMDAALAAARNRERYDECVKRLLGNKEVIARILIATVGEFKDAAPDEVIEKIEGNVSINSSFVEPGLTNQSIPLKDRIAGINTEDHVIGEGMIRFDILFYVWMRDGLSQMIINIEAQKSSSVGYSLLNRAIFYTSRIISSEKERDFANSRFDDMKPAYSIWICMDTKEDSLAHFHLTQDNIVGRSDWGGNIDLFNVVMVGVNLDEEQRDEDHGLHDFLRVLIGRKADAAKRMAVLRKDFGFKTDVVEKELVDVCNLSLIVEERGIKKGREEGRAEGLDEKGIQVFLNLLNRGMDRKVAQEIADISDELVEEAYRHQKK